MPQAGHPTMHRRPQFARTARFLAVLVPAGLMSLALLAASGAAAAAAAPTAGTAAPSTPAPAAAAPLMQIGPGDTINLSVFGQPDMNGAINIADDGTVSVPLIGPVQVGQLSPQEASRRIEEAFKKADVLVDPHVTITVTQARNQRVSVLGEVTTPGRYVIDSTSSPLDVLAQAGGVKESGAEVAYVIRRQPDGSSKRFPLNLRALARIGASEELPTLQAGDVLLVPPAEEYFVTGEVVAPARFRYHSGITVAEALARAGGVTAKGSENRVDIRRRLPNGRIKTLHPSANDLVEPDDIVQVKERLF
jgi:polysaccharide biosynthesis/export protein